LPVRCWPFGFTAFIGLLALTGIVVNDAIVLVDRVNQLRAAGRSLPEALREGAASRLQPILLTTFTTIAGLLPLTLFGGSMWGPMGWVIIGGLFAATLVTLLLVPALYFLLERGQAVPTRQPAAARPAGAVATAGLAILLVGPGAARAADLPAILEAVETHNPDLQALAAGVDAADAAWREAKSRRWPTLSWESGWQWTDDPQVTFGQTLLDIAGPEDLFGFDPDGSARLVTGQAAAEWILWDRSRGALVDAARHQRSGATWARAAARADLRLAAVSQYTLLRQLDAEADVLQSSIQLVAQERDDARARRDAGRGLEADVLGLEARAAELEAELAGVRGAATVARARLAELMGSAEPVEVGAESVRDPAPADLDGALAAARASRPELRGAAASVDAARSARDAAGGERWPQLVGAARVTATAPDDDLDRRQESTTAQLALRWRPLRGGGIDAATDRRRAEARRAEHAATAVWLRVRREVESAWSQRETARAQLAAARLAREAADEALRIVGLRFREGRDPLSRYLDAELAATRARAGTVRAAARLEVARAALARACGEEIRVD